MLCLADYFRMRIDHKYATPERKTNACILLNRVNDLLETYYEETGREVGIDADTGTQISGSRGGSGDGGFRLPQSRTGVKGSSHKQGMGVDLYDPYGQLGKWIRTHHLEKHDLYQEAMRFTPGWVHLQTRPTSRRIYNPW